MQYLKDLAEITSTGVKGNGNIELEIEGEIESLPDRGGLIVFNGDMGGTIRCMCGCNCAMEVVKCVILSYCC